MRQRGWTKSTVNYTTTKRKRTLVNRHRVTEWDEITSHLDRIRARNHRGRKEWTFLAGVVLLHLGIRSHA